MRDATQSPMYNYSNHNIINNKRKVFWMINVLVVHPKGLVSSTTQHAVELDSEEILLELLKLCQRVEEQKSTQLLLRCSQAP